MFHCVYQSRTLGNNQPICVCEKCPTTMPPKILNVIFLIIYLLSAAVQYNDPDAPVWIAMYLAAAMMCAMQFRPHLWRWPPRVLLTVSVVWAGTLLPSIIGQVSIADLFASLTMKTREVEEAREIGGLLLVGLWAAVLSFQTPQNTQ
jgi:Transmembrane family 220, helix